MTKRIISLLLLVLLSLPIASVTVSAEQSGIYENTTWRIDDNNIMYLSGTLPYFEPMGYYENVPWYDYNIESVVFDESIKNIPSYTFRNTSISSLTIPGTVSNIGKSAFSDSKNLATVELQSGITYIDTTAFEKCTKITEIIIPDTVTKLGASVFTNCNNLAKIVLSKNITETGNQLFSGCSSLTSVVIPSGIKILKNSTFLGCTSLQTVELPANLEEISHYAFKNCSSLKSITIPGTVKNIGAGIFQGCDALTDIYFEGTESDWKKVKVNTRDNEKLSEVSFHFTVPEHTHNFSVSVTPATCTTKGYTVSTCTICGYTEKSNETAALGHKYVRSSESKAATCTEDGQTVEICSRCNDRKVEIIPAKGHKFSVWIVTKEATASEEGERRRKCSVCGLVETENIPKAEIPDHTHNYASVVIQPDCTEIGYTVHFCTVCGDTYNTDEKPALGHKFGDWEIIKEATETEEGERQRACSECDEIETEVIPLKECPSEKMTDVDKSAWYHKSVDFVIEKGLFAGTSDTTFEPNTAMSRAMLVQVLYRFEGSPEVDFKQIFTDIPSGNWYSNAVIWAAENSIVAGIGNGKFNPNGIITREQLAVILYNYSKIKGKDVSATNDLAKFADADKTSDWALQAVKWAVGCSLISGTDKGLEPKTDATRAQVATVLMNYISNPLAPASPSGNSNDNDVDASKL